MTQVTVRDGKIITQHALDMLIIHHVGWARLELESTGELSQHWQGVFRGLLLANGMNDAQISELIKAVKEGVTK
jgi:hypothetical protein